MEHIDGRAAGEQRDSDALQGRQTALAALQLFDEAGVGNRSSGRRGEHHDAPFVGVAELVSRAFLLDDQITDLATLDTAIRRARSGHVTLDSAVVDTLVHRRSGSRLDELTLRELDVLREMAKGHTTPVIAESLFISIKAVERHVSNIYRKLRDVDAKRIDPRVSAVVAYLDTFGTARQVEE